MEVTWPRADFSALLSGLPAPPPFIFQDQLGSEQAIYRVNIANRQVEKRVQCGEILRAAPPLHLQRAWIDGSLYVMVERGLTDIYALDLDLP